MAESSGRVEVRGRGRSEVVVATFRHSVLAQHGLEGLLDDLGDGVQMAALISRADNGEIHFAETHDRSPGEGAMVGAGIGSIVALIGFAFQPLALLGVPLGAGIGALVEALHDGGYDDHELKGLGEDLPPGTAAVIATIGSSDVDRARAGLERRAASRIVMTSIDADLADVLDGYMRPDHAPDRARTLRRATGIPQAIAV
jgi:uncharacterized membrane protein